MGEIEKNYYAKQSKKIFIFTMLAESVILIALFAYFICVVSAYMDLMHGPQDEEEEKPDEEAKSASKKSEAKSEPKSGAGSAPKPEE